MDKSAVPSAKGETSGDWRQNVMPFQKTILTEITNKSYKGFDVTSVPNKHKNQKKNSVFKSDDDFAKLKQEYDLLLRAKIDDDQKHRLTMESIKKQNLDFAHAYSRMREELRRTKEKQKLVEYELVCCFEALKVKTHQLEEQQMAVAHRINKEVQDKTEEKIAEVSEASPPSLKEKHSSNKQPLEPKSSMAASSSFDQRPSRVRRDPTWMKDYICG